MSGIDTPAGFSSRVEGTRILLARPELLPDLVAEGLAAPETWEEILAAAAESPGRGRTARIGLRGGARLVLKRMRRGGLVGSWWSDRFAGSGRLVANLTIPAEVARRGIPTAPAAALLLEEGPKGLYRGWLATDEIAEASDLWTRLLRSPAPPREVLQAAAGLARRAHDAGIEHRDLNLGNLLVRERPEVRAFLVDLDAARLHGGPLPMGHRRAAVRRLARSYEKRFGPGGPVWSELYAGGDEALLRELRKGQALGRLSLAIHRAGWRSR